MKTKVLVTGASGQLGKTIQDLYAHNDNNIDFSFVSKSDLDITDTEALRIFFRLNRFSYCINCAAYTNVEQAEKTPEMAFKINAEGVKHLAEVCKTNSVVLIHISTDYVFDGEKNVPYLVTDTPNPINEYGKSKLLGEQYIQKILSAFYIVRTSWLYSKTFGNNFYTFIVNSAKQGHDLSITTDQVGCPTNTEDLARYIVEHFIEKSTAYGIYHYCNSKPMTWFDFTKQILAEHNLTDKVILKAVSTYKTFAKRPEYSVLG